jgi:hypothetical protein
MLAISTLGGQVAHRTEGPMLGLAFDRTAKVIRPLWGVPGSALSGAAVDVGFEIADAQVTRNSAVVVSTGGAVYFVRIQNGTAQGLPTNVAPHPSAIAISANGSHAALYYRDEGSITILKLNEGAQVDKTAPAPQGADAVAISDDGQALAIAVNTTPGCSPTGRRPGGMRSHAPAHDACAAAGGSGLQVMNRTGQWSTIAQRAHISSLAFLPSSTDLVYADERRGIVAVVRAVLGQPTTQILLDRDRRMPSPAAVQPGPGLRVVAGSRDGAVAILDTAGGEPTFLTCGCEPTRVAPVRGAHDLYLLNDFAGGIVWMLDAAKSRLLFVPPENDAVAQGPRR